MRVSFWFRQAVRGGTGTLQRPSLNQLVKGVSLLQGSAHEHGWFEDG
jgi:hypothetical protein